MRRTYTIEIAPEPGGKGINWQLIDRIGPFDAAPFRESGGRPCRTAPTTREGWLAYCRRHGGEIRPDRWSRLRWAEATITPAGADYRNGARLVWEV